MLGAKIKYYRVLFGWSQEELGKKLTVNGKQVSGKTIWSWENGRTEPNMGAVQQLADLFSVSTDDLIKDKNISVTDDFKTPQDAVRYIASLPVFAAYGGKKVSEMSDEEKIKFANQVVKYMKMITEDDDNI